MNYGNCLSLRGGLIIRKRAIGVAILANVLGTVRTKSVGAHLKANLSARHGVRFARLDVVDREPRSRLRKWWRLCVKNAPAAALKTN